MYTLRVWGWLGAIASGCAATTAPLPTETWVSPETAQSVAEAEVLRADGLGRVSIEQVDVLVIGAGPAGLAAAVEATHRGQTVRVLEARDMKEDYLPRTWLFAGTELQLQEEIADSGEILLDEWTDLTGGDPDSPRVAGYALHQAELVYDWMTGLGYEFALDSCNRCEGMGSRRRLHTMLSTHNYFYDELDSDTVRLATAAESLVVAPDGRVVGAEFYDWQTGEVGWIEARWTVVATGGFLADLDRVVAARPELEDVDLWVGSLPWADGNGHDMVTAVGGDVVNESAIGLYGHLLPDPFSGTGATAPTIAHGIWVDSTGTRFTNETAASSMDNGEAAAARPGGIVWAILDDRTGPRIRFDDESRDYSLTLQDLQDAELAHTADSLDGLALATDLPAEVLAQSVDAWNTQLAEDLPDPFGRDRPDEHPIASPPFHAVRVVVTPCKAFGGIAVNDAGIVLDTAGRPIRGLLAAGEAAGMAGGSLVGSDFASGQASGFSGSVTAVVYSGRVAGATASGQEL